MEVDYLHEYESFVYRNISPKVPVEMRLAWAQMGLVAETGELVEIYEKALRKKGGVDPDDLDKMVDEAGDVLWYLTALCTELGIGLEELIDHNIRKLKARGNK